MTNIATGYTRVTPNTSYSWTVRINVIGVVSRGPVEGSEHLHWYCLCELQTLDLLQTPDLEAAVPISNLHVPVVQPFVPKRPRQGDNQGGNGPVM